MLCLATCSYIEHWIENLLDLWYVSSSGFQLSPSHRPTTTIKTYNSFVS
jgi:hypothetical protein